MSFTVSCITLAVFAILILGGLLIKNKFLDNYNKKTFEKTAGENAIKILEQYDIVDDSVADMSTKTTTDDLELEEIVSVDNKEEEATETNTRRIYDSFEKSYRNYESFDDDDLTIKNEINNEEKPVIDSAYVEIIKGKNKHYIKTKRHFGVKLSKDIYMSNSISANCIACYEATKLSETVFKKFIYKILSLLLFLPLAISQLSWFIIVLYITGVFPFPDKWMLPFSCLSLVCYLLTMLHFLYFNYIAKQTRNNMIKLGIIDSEENKNEVMKILSILAFSNTTQKFYTLRWFLKLVLGYKV